MIPSPHQPLVTTPQSSGVDNNFSACLGARSVHHWRLLCRPLVEVENEVDPERTAYGGTFLHLNLCTTKWVWTTETRRKQTLI